MSDKSLLESLGRGAWQGASLGYGDEAEAKIRSILAQAGITQEAGGGSYEGIRDAIRAGNQEAREANPKAYLGGEMLGGAASMALPGAAMARGLKGASAAGKFGVNAAAGFAEGGAAGAGYNEGENLGEDMLTGALTGGLVGGGMSAGGSLLDSIKGKGASGQAMRRGNQLERDSRAADKLASMEQGNIRSDITMADDGRVRSATMRGNDIVDSDVWTSEYVGQGDGARRRILSTDMTDSGVGRSTGGNIGLGDEQVSDRLSEMFRWAGENDVSRLDIHGTISPGKAHVIKQGAKRAGAKVFKARGAYVDGGGSWVSNTMGTPVFRVQPPKGAGKLGSIGVTERMGSLTPAQKRQSRMGGDFNKAQAASRIAPEMETAFQKFMPILQKAMERGGMSAVAATHSALYNSDELYRQLYDQHLSEGK